MGQRVIPVAVTAEYIGGDGVTLGAAGSHNSVLVEYDFRSAGPQWEGVSGRYVLWTNPQGNNTNRINLGVSEMVEGYDGVYQAAPPPDAMCVPGWAEMVVVGFTLEDGKEITKVKTEPSRFRVLPGARGSADNEGIATTVADQLQAEIQGVYSRLDSKKVNKPTTPHDVNGTKGQILETLGDGSTRWRDEIVATQEVIDEVLEKHPEWVTTVQPGGVGTRHLADGAVTQDKLDGDLKLRVVNAYVTPQMFGAKGDGVTDDTAAVQAAIDHCIANGNMLFIPKGVYYISDTLRINASIKIVGENKYTSIFVAGRDMVDHSGVKPIVKTLIEVRSEAARQATTLRNNHNGYRCIEGEQYITLTNPDDVCEGDILRISALFDDHPWTADNRNSGVFGETNVVAYVNEGKAYLRSPVAYTFPSTSTISVEARPAIKDVVIDNIQLRTEPQVQGDNKYNYYNGLYVMDCLDAVISNVIASGFGGIGIQSSVSYHTVIKNCRAEDCWTLNGDGTVYTAAGYGLRFVSDRGSVVSQCEAVDGKHCFDASGAPYPTYGCVVENSRLEQTRDIFETCLATHGLCDGLTVRDNIINATGKNAVGTNGERLSIVGNKLIGDISFAFGGDHIVKGNEIIDGGIKTKRPEINHAERYLIIEDNILKGDNLAAVLGLYNGGDTRVYDTVYGLVMRDNLLITKTASPLAINLAWTGADSTSFQRGFVLSGNVVRRGQIGTNAPYTALLDAISGPEKSYTIGANLSDMFITSEFGSTAHADNSTTVAIGSCRYNRTLKQPLWYDGTYWRDSSGATINS